MKKIMLLLGALSLVSSVAYAKEVVPAVEEVAVVEEVKPAAPTLTVTSIGQYVEVDNTSGGEDIGEEVYFGNTVDFAYGEDWTFQLLAHKTWYMDTDDGINSRDHRIEIGGWRHFDNFSLGMKWRNQSDYDRLYLRGKYSYGMFSGWADIAYQANNSSDADVDDNDAWYSEGMPIAITVGPVTLGYYYELNTLTIGNTKEGEREHLLDHQLRLMFPLYTGEKLSLSAEYRWQFAQDQEYDGKAFVDGVEGYQEKTGHKAILKAAYAVTDNFTIDGYYRYDFNEYEAKDGAAKDKADNYYGEFYAGWTYTF